MRESTCVISCVFNDYDLIPPVPDGFDEAILVSDKDVRSDWKNIVLKNDLGPIYKSKLVKMRPDIFTTANYSVYMDANFRDSRGWLSGNFLPKLDSSEFIIIKHPERVSVEDEVKFSTNIPKYKNYDLSDQFRYLQTCGFSDDIGLFATGLIGRVHSEKVKYLGNEWLLQNLIFSPHCQISLPFLLQKYNVNYTVINENLWGKSFKWVRHLDPHNQGQGKKSIFSF
jgi:hypothetical protein